MSDNSHIEWTDATWNPVTGCSVVSPGCTNCYAMRLAGTRLAHHPSRAGLTVDSKAGPVWNGEVRFNEQWLDQPLRWRRPRMVFVCAHGDLFHESVPDAWIDKVFAVMALAPQHTFQVLTKRAGRMRAYLSNPATPDRIVFHLTGQIHVWHEWAAKPVTVDHDRQECHLAAWPLPNVWLGVSAEDQQRADERIPELLATPAAVRFASLEPLLGPINLERICLVPQKPGSIRAGIHLDTLGGRYFESGMPYVGEWDDPAGPPPVTPIRLDWVIVGGESGKAARPMHPDWARSLRDQCTGTGVPFFFKQWGEWGPGAEFTADISAREVYRGEVQTLQIAGSRDIKLCIPTRDDDVLGPALTLERYGKALAGRQLDDREWSELPGRLES